MARENTKILTVGHSNHTSSAFSSLLQLHNVTALADVRSSPYSRFNPHFSRKQLKEDLATIGIRYVYLGEELGGRSEDVSFYQDGRIRYDRLAQTAQFHSGLQRLLQGMEKYRIALMCSEQEPLHCHRTLLVGQELARLGVAVEHILSDGSLETHESAMDRLLAEFNLVSDTDWFLNDVPRDERISQAIFRQSKRVGHAIGQAAYGPRKGAS